MEATPKAAKALDEGKAAGKSLATTLDEAERLGFQGKSVSIDAGDIEDQNALVFVESHQNKVRTVVKMKIRPEAAKGMEKILNK
jgi:hypothetical protein